MNAPNKERLRGYLRMSREQRVEHVNDLIKQLAEIYLLDEMTTDMDFYNNDPRLADPDQPRTIEDVLESDYLNCTESHDLGWPAAAVHEVIEEWVKADPELNVKGLRPGDLEVG